MLYWIVIVLSRALLLCLPALVLLFFLRDRPTDKMAFSVLGFQALILVARYAIGPLVWALKRGNIYPHTVLEPLYWYHGEGGVALWPGVLAAGVTVLVLMLVVSRRKTPDN